MFTVLIAEKEHIDAIRQGNKLFFEPFLESKDLAFCYWNPAGQTLQEAVPGLLDEVGRKREWRAVVVNNCTVKSSKTRNPFDVVDYSEIAAMPMPDRQPMTGQDWEEWEDEWRTYYTALAEKKEAVYKEALDYPLQRLATWLCFRPEDYIHNEVREKKDVHDWAMELLGRDEIKPSAKLEIMERDQYKFEQRVKEKLRRNFLAGSCLNIAYPSEVHCITLRAAESNYFDPDTYWNIRQDSEYSAFTDRNMYFDRMRFMVFDLISPAHRNFRTEYIRFLATVLIFSSNPVPSSGMQARRLYYLEVDTDDTPLCTLVTSYDKKLAATSAVIDNEMEKIRSEIPDELTDKAAEALFCTPKDISVVLDESCDPEKVYADKDYGLFFDEPQYENDKWAHDRQASEKALVYIAKQQARSVRKSVAQTHQASEISEVNISRLTPLQVDDIREYTDAAEDEMIESVPPDLTDISQYTDRLEQASENVKKVIGQRMTRKTTLILGGIGLGLYLICFLPFLFANGGTGSTVATAVILSAFMMLLVAAAMFVALIFLRGSVVKAVKSYNNTAKEVMQEIQSSLKRVSKYLGALCNVRRGHAVQNYAQKNMDEYTRSLRIRKKHQEDIRRKRAYLAEGYQDYFGDKSFCDETMARPYDYDFEQKTEYEYPAPFLAGDFRQIEFISSGNFVTVPSSYVTRILVRMEGIYEN